MIIRNINVKKSSKSNQKLKIFVVLFILFFVIIPVVRINSRIKAVSASGKALKKAFAQNDIELVKKDLVVFSKDYDKLRKTSRWIYWAVFIPYVADYKNGLEGGAYLVSAAKESVDAIYPYADLIGFKKGESSFAEKSAEDRLQTAVLTLDKVLVKVDPISEDIRKAQEKINKINPNRYPKGLGKIIIRNRVINLKDQINGASSLFVDAKPLLKKLPEILGKDEEKTYLILFQNDKERRATGGFLTSYAIFKINKGKIRVEKSDDIYNLDNSISSHPTAPKEILTYHKNVSRFFIRDSNLSPDFVESLDLFYSLYNKSNQKVKHDGVIALDSKVLVDMLTIYGDTEVNGIVFSSKEDKRCDCPQVLYQLFDIVDRPVAYIKENRKGILGELMFALLNKALGFSPSKYWGIMTQNMFENLKEKHILLNFEEKGLQDAVEKVGFAGRINDTSGDYLHINNVNFAGAKSNLFVKESIESKTIFKSKEIEREVSIEFKNPYPHSDCNLERGGLCLNATLRNWIRFYVPEGSELIEFSGSRKKVRTYDELGKTVFEGFITVDPLGKAQAIVRYKLPASIAASKYRLFIQKQPGVESQELNVLFNGRRVFEGELEKDIIVEGK